MLPLYIEGISGCRVEFDDPALRVSIPNRADRLFPLSRISRVICNGKMDWTMSALLACADAGIQILFLEGSGEIRARWLGRSGERQSLTQRLVDLITFTDGKELYANWYLSMEKLAVRCFARRIGLPDWRDCSAPEMYQRLQIQLGNEGLYRACLLESVLYGELITWLSTCGFEQDNEALLSAKLNLATDLSKLLLWDFYPRLLEMNIQTTESPLETMAYLFQRHSDRCYSLLRSCINKLHQFLMTTR